MLRLILGKAGTGKTAQITREIRELIGSGKKGIYLIVPEQFSHEAERELCRVCGDTLSVYAEVLSFRSLARKVKTQVGGIASEMLDKGGKLLCMSLAMRTAGERLEIFRSVAQKPEFQSMLLSMSDRMKLAGIGPEKMIEAAAQCEGELAGKLRDLALVTETYNAIIANGHADPADSLAVLACQLPSGRMTKGCTYYIDGFTDFTGAEYQVIRTLMENGADVTVCLTADDLTGKNEIYALARLSASMLKSEAEHLGVECRVETVKSMSTSPAALLAENIFTYAEGKIGDTDAIEIYTADNMTAECEFAAAKVQELIRTKNYRWRDVAVAVRGYADYAPILERVFEEYGVPLFSAKKRSLITKPLPELIALAYEVTETGWRPDSMIAYLETGLTGLSPEECDLLSEYVYKWQLFENMWLSESEWRQHPGGYGKDYDLETEELLGRINAVRRNVASPLVKFRKRNKEAKTAGEYAKSLAAFLQELRIPEQLRAKAEEELIDGRRVAGMEDTQVWKIVVSALEQIHALTGDMPVETGVFSQLFLLMLGQYDIAVIPASLDRVSAGDFDRMRRRNIRHLIILGAEDERLPGPESEGGIFTNDETERLEKADIILGARQGGELWREFTLVYNCVSLPSDGLTICRPVFSAEGRETRKSVVMSQAEKLFGLKMKKAELSESRTAALRPAMTLALTDHGRGGKAAREYFAEAMPGRLESNTAKAELRRGSLSEESVAALYGKYPHVSASRAESFFACKYAYFCKFGLKAGPYEPIVYSPAEIGTFIHYVLENVARDISAEGGFKEVTESRISKLTERYINEYIADRLKDFREKSERFVYLFRRVCANVRHIVSDMTAEMKKSDFVPLAFEVKLGEVCSGTVRISGVADRIDGWEKDGKTYLRVVDYKTGRKKFSAEDIWYGRNMQMILYLDALSSDGAGSAKALHLPEGTKCVPAGVMYVPARDDYARLTNRAEQEKKDSLRRSGIVLNSEEVRTAWESGNDSDRIYIPKDMSRKKEDRSLVGEEDISVMFRHVRKKMDEMLCGIRSGDIAADPYETAQKNTPCDVCDYRGKCGFEDGENGESLRILPKLTTEDAWEKMREECGVNG